MALVATRDPSSQAIDIFKGGRKSRYSLVNSSKLCSITHSTINLIRPHLGSSRKIHPGQRIHTSFVLSDNTEYIPKARSAVNEDGFWGDLRDESQTELRHKWLERDLKDYTWDIVRRFIDKPSSSLEGLGEYTPSGKFSELQTLVQADVLLAQSMASKQCTMQ